MYTKAISKQKYLQNFYKLQMQYPYVKTVVLNKELKSLFGPPVDSHT